MRALKVAGVLSAAVLLAGAASGPDNPKNVPPNAAVANAAMQDDTTAVRKLLASGADVNVAQGDGMTALHWAAERGDLAMANVLHQGARQREGRHPPRLRTRRCMSRARTATPPSCVR